MAIQRVLTEHVISVSEFRKNPAEVFEEEQPVAITSNNRIQGYFVGREVYEQMVELIESSSPRETAQFRPSLARLNAIKQACATSLAKASEADFGNFQEA